ncbi:MAG TPA: 4Fe-4S dicluster domain-containing protein, partial [Aromatoleum sp.]|uniref:4Fe-4S dicluster domain-containing protein n=1 Tax=Aromatoleum sp. TaxID=2307007 RepID=UPI002B499D8F
MTQRAFIPIRASPDNERESAADPGRRGFLQLMAASLALAGSGCSGPPAEKILPYVAMPEDVLPGQPTFYATSLVRRGYGLGVLVESNMGRPTKVEGNPGHPASRGATDVFAQASVLQFWDPDRSQTPMRGQQPVSWRDAEAFMLDCGEALIARGGAGLAVLTGTVTSETWLAEWRSLLRRYPEARWYCHDPLHDDGAFEAAQMGFGRHVDTVFHLDRARVVVSLAADVFGDGPGSVAYARDFAELRRRADRPSRLYAVDAVLGLTGANADERLALSPDRIERVVWRLAAALGVGEAAGVEADADTARWEAAFAEALQTNRGESVVMAGPALSPETRALVHVINGILGNVGRSVDYIAPVAAEPGSHAESLTALCERMRSGRVESLLILGANPVYDAPAELDFGGALSSVPRTVHAGLYRDETALRCVWHLPLAHEFEHWSDARGYDGTIGVIQPVIRPLYGGRSAREILGMFGRPGQRSDHDAVRGELGDRIGGRGEGFEAAWDRCLRDGVIAGTAALPLHLGPAAIPRRPSFDAASLTAVFVADSAVDDGSFANNAWLQELPRPLTKLTWDNAALVSPGTAAALGLANGDVVELSGAGRSVAAPVWILPGMGDGTVGICLGYGRWAAGRVGDGVGFNGYRLKPGVGVTLPVVVRTTGDRHAFACTQLVASMMGRPLARHATVGELRDLPMEKSAAAESLYPPYDYPSHAWAMAIDLNACIGCGACTIACQAENNIPVVGKDQVMRTREMHWIRVDTYFEGGLDAPATYNQPVPCMQCEDAPCEQVCPVAATVHDSQGLNVMVYNRCLGTRYCSNNCPYKVRRFNFFNFTKDTPAILKLAMNPDVTVRARGVMEKCTY